MAINLYAYRFGSAEFDEARGELFVAGLPVDVEPKALALLAYLLPRVGEVISKETLLGEVWAGQVTVEKVLPNAINKLRRALGATNAERIVTLPRVGYRLDGPVSRVAVGQHHALELEFAVDQPVPGRENFILKGLLAKRQGGEVWLAEHSKTAERRVYKFALDSERLRALKREVTLSRLLQESVPDGAQFVDIIDWNLERVPFFLECADGGENLLEWAGQHLTNLSQDKRLGLFLQVADAVAQAHAVGVLHKDLKPGNILIRARPGGWQIQLTDFGNASLLEPERLSALGITQLGMTLTEGLDGLSGTPLYVAPELFAGMQPTLQSDLFALGILLYQLMAGRLGQPMVSSWEDDIAEPLLREDLRLATAGDPQRRLGSVAALALRLRDWPARRAQADQLAASLALVQAAKESAAQTRARRPYLFALIATLVLGMMTALVLWQSALRARNAANAELDRANALSAFVTEDLISRANPLIAAKGQSATVSDVLIAAAARVKQRFSEQPLAEATIHASLGGLFESIDQWPMAEQETRLALALYSAQNAESREVMRQRWRLAGVLTRLGRFDEALIELDHLQKLAAASNDAESRYLISSARSTYHLTRAEFVKAVPTLESAIQALETHAPSSTQQLDALKIQLIFAYTLTDAPAAAQALGAALLKQASARGEDASTLVALTKVALARSFSYQQNHDRAFALLLEAQPVIVARLGRDHSQHLRLLGELVGVAFRKPDWPKTLLYVKDLHALMAAKLGPKHNQTYVMLVNWGRAFYELGRDEEAAVKLREAYAGMRESQGAEHPQSQDAAYALAAAELELNNLDEADALIATINAADLAASRGNQNWTFALGGLRGLVLLKRGQTQAAQPLIQTALEKLKPEPNAAPDRFYRECEAALQQLANR